VAVHGVRLMAELRRLNGELQRSREGLVLAREEERRRLRADLHDDLGPTLAALAMAAGKAGRLVPRDPDAAVRQLDELRDALRARVGDIRALAYNLRPPALDDLGLLAAVRDRAANLSDAPGGLAVRVEADEPLPALPAAVEVAAYRIAQEALANVARHSGARRCTVRLRAADGLLILEVADDGAGVADGSRAGIGVRSMRERAAELGGTLAVGAAPGGGAVLRVSLPI
jgi:two-component system NarL family sensor kinase